jgi:hypothetical protein
MQKMLLLIFVFISIAGYSQKKNSDQLNEIIKTSEIEAHLSFLAADEMRGRNAGSPELNIAANYIKAYFKIQGLKTLSGAENYFQPVEQIKNLPATTGEVTLRQQHFTLKNNLLVMGGEDSLDWKGELIYVGYGSMEELEKYDLKGKMVLALAGSKGADNLNKVFADSYDKDKLIQKKGALGLIELLVLPQAPWPALVNYLSQPQWTIKREGASLPHAWLKPADLNSIAFKEGEMVEGSFFFQGRKKIGVPGKNVVGLIEGTDAKLKDEYIILTAHYDHIGVQKATEGTDSIYNGARDNAIGTVALLQAAKYLSKNPSKHPVIILALTSEEKGLLGSQWYTEHPLVPLNKHILDVNCDGVGYNDKSIITSISFGRTNADQHITKAASTFGLKVGGDPDPKENFYDRSDQVSFAKKGIPAIKLQPGLAQMDDEIRKYYHRAADEVSSLDLEYLTKFYKAYLFSVQSLTNETQRFAWKAGDKYEDVSKALYNEK